MIDLFGARGYLNLKNTEIIKITKQMWGHLWWANLSLLTPQAHLNRDHWQPGVPGIQEGGPPSAPTLPQDLLRGEHPLEALLQADHECGQVLQEGQAQPMPPGGWGVPPLQEPRLLQPPGWQWQCRSQCWEARVDVLSPSRLGWQGCWWVHWVSHHGWQGRMICPLDWGIVSIIWDKCSFGIIQLFRHFLHATVLQCYWKNNSYFIFWAFYVSIEIRTCSI